MHAGKNKSVAPMKSPPSNSEDSIKATVAIDAHDIIGEGPTWNTACQRLLWSDNERGIVHEAASGGPGGHWRESKRWNLSRPLAAAIPRARGGLVVAGGTEIFTLDEVGRITPFACLDVDPNLVRLNDAKCDPQGRLWAGTLATDFSSRAGLYRIDPDRSVTPMLSNLRLANGLGWSPDGSTFYFIDSLSERIDAFDFDACDGVITNRRTVVTLDHGAPNGMTVDREGCLWVAATGTGQVHRYTPDGTLLTRVTISTPGATSCAFGGADGGDLFITSLGRRMPEVALELGLTSEMMENDRAESGSLFVCRPGPTGSPATPFAG
jgi:sugar lactone lactonase YvrE